MKTTAHLLMLVISISMSTPAFAQGSLKIEAARQIADSAGKETSTAESRQAAVATISEIANSMSPAEQEDLLDQVVLQTLATTLSAYDRAADKQDTAAAGAVILAFGLAIAIVTPKTGSVSKLAAGAAIGGGLLAAYNQYIASGITSGTKEHTRELQRSLHELREQLRLKNKAGAL